METLRVVDPSLLGITSEQIQALGPYFWMVGGTALATLFSAFHGKKTKFFVFLVTAVAAAIGLLASAKMVGMNSLPIFNGMMISDSFSHFFNVLVIFAALFTILCSHHYLDKEQLQYSEYYTLILFSTLGMMLMVAAMDLVSIFISLEIMSLSAYVLVGFRRADRKSNEAAMKYFVLGSAASAIFLYGASILYGATGVMSIPGILDFFTKNAGQMGPAFSLGAWLAIVGFLFKVAAVPFHMWTPDVYEGAPTPITGFMSTGIKAASFAVLIRLLDGLGFGKGLENALSGQLHNILWVIAVLSMLVGNIVALKQNNLKRMFAFSAIAHTGYLLVGIIAAPNSEFGYGPLVLYLISYVAMTLGTFGVLTMISGKGDTRLNLQDLAGLSKRHPWLAITMGVFMFSMAGIPPTAGFVSKYYLFYSAIQAGEIWLVVLSVLCSVISVYYYLRVLVFIYMKDSPESQAGTHWIPAYGAMAIAMMVAITLQIGIAPSRLLELSKWVTQIH